MTQPWERNAPARPARQGQSSRGGQPWETGRSVPERQQSRPEAAARSVRDAFLFGRADELQGAFARLGSGDIAGGVEAIRRNLPFSGLTNLSPERQAQLREVDRRRVFANILANDVVTERGQEAEEQVTQRARANLLQAQRQHPVSSAIGALAGGLALAPLIPGGPATGYLGRIGTGVAAGAAGGSAYGYNTGTDAQSRAEGMRSGALFGGALGGAFPAAATPIMGAFRIRDPRQAMAATGAIGAAGGAGIGAGASLLTGGDGEQMRDWATQGAVAGGLLGAGAVGASRIRPQPNTLSMSIGAPPGAMSGPPGRASPEVEMMTRLVQRARLSPEEIGRRLDEAAATPRARVLADVLGESAQYRAGTIARMPGQTRGIAEERMSERFVRQGRRLAEQIVGPRAANELDADAVEVLAQRVSTASEMELRPLLRSAGPEQQRTAQAALDNLMRRPSVQNAMQTADENIAEEVASGRMSPEMAANPIQRLHELKIVLQGQAGDPNLLPRNSAARLNNMQLVTAARAASDAIEASAPGYATVMEQLQNVIVPREIMRIVSTAQRGDEVNVARAALRNLQVRDAIQDPRFARIGDELRIERDLYESGATMSPNTGSPTAPRLADMADQITSETPPTSYQDLAARFARAASAGFREDFRNRVGQALYTPIDPGLSGYDPQQIAALRRAIVDELRRRQAASRAAAVGGFTGGLGGGAVE